MIKKQDKNLLPPDLYSRNTVIAQLTSLLFPEGQMKVLDVGGRGAKLNWFMPESVNYAILDLAPKGDDEECEYKQGDAQKIPFSDRNFDLVVSTDMLEHIDKPFRAPAIREMLRITKNHLILGAPCGNGLISIAEDIIGKQYRKITGQEHPFLNEHIFYGLPTEEKIEEILNRENVKFFKVKEGNLMSWYIQQLYTGALNGQDLESATYEFNRYFNDNLFELGNLRSPTYRTFYVIVKEGELPELSAVEEFEAKHTWNPGMFMELLEKAFADIRLTIDEKKRLLLKTENAFNQEKKQFQALENTLNDLRKEYEDIHARSARSGHQLVEKDEKIKQLEGVLGKAKESLKVYREAVREVRTVLREKEQAINIFRNIVEEKDKIINRLKESETRLQELIRRETEQNRDAMAELREKDVALTGLRNRLEESDSLILAKESELETVKADLDDHQKALREVVNSRAWKTVMAYSAVKNKVMGIGRGVKGAGKTALTGWKVLTTLGPSVFVRRVKGKFKKSSVLAEGGDPYDLYIEKTEMESCGKSGATKKIADFNYTPVISVVMPVYNVDEKWLKKAIESVRSQWYTRFELCICNDASTNSGIKDLLNDYGTLDRRIKVMHRQHNGGIVKASNDALKLATGAYVTFLDNDDELTPDALFEVVKSLQATRHDLIYTDEDKIDEAGARSEPFFKPAWSPDLLLSCNYICHLAVYKRKIVNELGGLRVGFEGSQDFDLVLRFTEKTKSIKHIPKILYHWRKIPGSAASSVDAKPYAYDSAKKALEQIMRSKGIEGEVKDGIWKGSYRIQRKLISNPLVSIIIPFKDKIELLKPCLNSILNKTTYENYEIILINNRSELSETVEYLSELQNSASENKIKVYDYDHPFNYSAINNFAVNKANGEMLVLLNNDTEVISKDWLEAMLEHAQRPEVGAVGAKLLYPDNLIQHAGVVIGIGGIANCVFAKHQKDDSGYCGQINVIRNYSAVTGACMMVRKDVYKRVEGLNEQDLAVTFNDIDFCLRIREKGFLIVYTPYAQLYHHESVSRGFDVDIKEVSFMQRTHGGLLKRGDPYYNPNLTHERVDFSLRVVDKLPKTP